MSTAYQLTSDKDSITIRLSREMMDEASLARLLDYLEMEVVRRRSQLTEEEAACLAEETKQRAWQ